jgi:glutamate dehydrogenase
MVRSGRMYVALYTVAGTHLSDDRSSGATLGYWLQAANYSALLLGFVEALPLVRSGRFPLVRLTDSSVAPRYGVYSSRKYVEQFSNGITLISAYLNPLRGPPLEQSILQIAREASLIYCLPNNPFFNAHETQSSAVQEAAYAYAGWVFCQHFLNRLGSAYQSLKSILNENDPNQAAVLSDIRTRFRQETFTRQSIMEAIQNWPELMRELYIQFALVHYISGANQLVPTLSYQRINTGAILSAEELHAKIKRTVTDKQEIQVLESFLIFNKAILKSVHFTWFWIL